MKIVVTQEHIDKARAYYLEGLDVKTHCPISLATKGKTGFFFLWSKNHKIYRTTNEMQEFIRNFDNGNHVEPSTFMVKRERRKFYQDKDENYNYSWNCYK
jgi:hypothetical protein